MKKFTIDEPTLQAVAQYIAQNPCPNMPVSVPVQLLSKLQQLPEVDAAKPDGFGMKPHAAE